ncbi:MAG: NFACT RNA binding domain-containing protein [Spirochaetes bacterium]|nr:NFACT RNA binding domain-containing protein [Spirochaetota bacterium]
MSLNWKEIDLVLSELDLSGAQIQKIVQPSYDTLLLCTYSGRGSVDLLVCVAHGACRLHATSRPVPKSERPIRFCELLKARILNGRIASVRQLGAERIVRFDLRCKDGDYLLYARLWSGAANIILTDPSGNIADALARKPSKGEIAGGMYRPEAMIPESPPARDFSIREFADDPAPTFNERVDAHYSRSGGGASRETLLERIRARVAERRFAIESRIDELERVASSYADPDRFREIGDILMAQAGKKPAGRFVEAPDFYRGGVVHVEIEPDATMVENAASYYQKHRKARSGASDIAQELALARERAAVLDRELAGLEKEENPFVLRNYLVRVQAEKERGRKGFGGISLERDGWKILVGRSARENDALLRSHVRGNDLWLHARDYSGSYVFVKVKPGKTVPLEILVDAGTLALYYSKGRLAGRGDLYYTFVKYLRRAKDGPVGLVIPTQEKNLRIVIDETRLRSLKALIGRED